MAALARGNADAMLETPVDLPAPSIKVSVIPGKVRLLCLLRRCVELITHAAFLWGVQNTCLYI